MNLSIYSLYLDMESFGLSIFVTQLLYGVFEVPSVLLSMWLLDIFGRKILFIATLLIGGVSSILILAVPDSKSLVISQNTFYFCLIIMFMFTFINYLFHYVRLRHFCHIFSCCVSFFLDMGWLYLYGLYAGVVSNIG